MVAAEGELPLRKPRQQKRKRLKRLVSFYQNMMLPFYSASSVSFTNIQMTFSICVLSSIAPATDMFGGGDGGDY